MLKKSIIIITYIFLNFAVSVSFADTQIFTKVLHKWNGPKEVSLLLKFKGPKSTNISSKPHGIKTRNFIEVWNQLYIQIYSQGHAKVKEENWGYHFSFSSDEDGKTILTPSYGPRHGKTPNHITATDFLEGDKSFPSILGTMYVNAPGEVRFINYPNFTVEIRTLEIELSEKNQGDMVSLLSFSCLVKIIEKAKDKN